jgi:outer membrane protein assembly factor BamB
MTIAQTESTPRKPLRLWPGVVIVILQWLARYAVPVVAPEALPFAVMGGVAGGLAILVWWVFFSRAPWSERVGAIALMIVALFTTSRLVHESLATGAMGILLYILAIPVLSLALVAWAVGSRRLSAGPRRAALVATILIACGMWTLLRTNGFDSNFNNDFQWRWAETPEERLLAQAANEALDVAPGAPQAQQAVPAPAPIPPAPIAADAGNGAIDLARAASGALPAAPATDGTAPAPSTAADWPGFRGPERDGVIRGARIETDWSKSPPAELWRKPIGPGWSSFAVRGDLLYTQEQRGDDEVVACYRMSTGEPVWRHRDAARFWESNAGAGPRGTPTLSNGRVYTFGATGILNALDAGTGAVVWSRNAAADNGTKVPDWGFASSPLVVDDLVIVAVSGALVAYDLASGRPRWSGPVGGEGYSSPQLVTLDGVAQILALNGSGVVGVAPADGTLLWQHSWGGYPIVQPALTAGGDVLISVADGSGTRRLAVAHGPGGWSVEERWTSNGLKPYFNDFVVHEGHAFGFDGGILASINLEDGQRRWKGGRYGQGQMVLLPDQDVLLVLSEEGELALVGATPEKFTELARFPALDGKTWNHPVLVGDVLLVRNGEEMAAFRLSLARP